MGNCSLSNTQMPFISNDQICAQFIINIIKKIIITISYNF